jgi:hypothetical protein
MANNGVNPIAGQLAKALDSADMDQRSPVAGLPLGTLFAPLPASSLYCAVTPIDDRGRLADRSPIRAMKWQPGQRLTLSVTQGMAMAAPQPNGAECITSHGYLRLPARIRHVCRIAPGDRLLIAAMPESRSVVVYTMPLLESLLIHHPSAWGQADKAGQ